MGRPAKPAAVSSGKIGKDKRSTRQKKEELLKGKVDKLSPPDWLNERQKEVFTYVAQELAGGKIVGNVDVFVLTSFAVAVDRLEKIEQLLNRDSDAMLDRSLMLAKSKYTADFNTGIKELSLSPQARAKLGGINLDAEKESMDPVLMLLNGGGKKTTGA